MKAGWETKRLEEICSIELGSTPPRGSPRFWDTERTTGNVWLSIADLLKGAGVVVSDSKEYLSNEGRARGKMVKAGTLLLSFKLTIGRLAFAGCDLQTNEAIAALDIIATPKISKEYLYWYLMFFDWDKASEGEDKIKGKTLNKAKLRLIEVIIPPLDEQRRIVAVLDKAFAAIATASANAQKNLTNARALFESYLQSAFDRDGGEWSLYNLGDTALIRIIDGDRGANYPNKSDFSGHGHCVFLNTKNVRPDGFNFDSVMFVSKEKDANLRKGKLTRGDVIMTTRGTIGNLAVYDDSVDFEHVRINSGMLIFRPSTERISPRYLFEILRSGIVKKQIEANVSGAAQPQLPIHTLSKFQIPVPNSLADQSRIVQDLSKMESATNRLEDLFQTKLAALTELKQSLLKRAFAGELT